MTEPTATAFVPAKAISIGINRKNMVDIGGTPLLGWTLEFCKRCPFIDQVVVATEDEKIKEYATVRGATIFDLTTDDIEDRRTVRNLWKVFCQDKTGPQALLHLVYPFRRQETWDFAWREFQNQNLDLLFTVQEESRPVYASDLTPLTENRMTRLRRLSKPKFVLDGDCYIAKAEYIAGCTEYEEGEVAVLPNDCISGCEIETQASLRLARLVAQSVGDWWNNENQFPKEQHALVRAS